MNTSKNTSSLHSARISNHTIACFAYILLKSKALKIHRKLTKVVMMIIFLQWWSDKWEIYLSKKNVLGVSCTLSLQDFLIVLIGHMLAVPLWSVFRIFKVQRSDYIVVLWNDLTTKLKVILSSPPNFVKRK